MTSPFDPTGLDTVDSRHAPCRPETQGTDPIPPLSLKSPSPRRLDVPLWDDAQRMASMHAALGQRPGGEDLWIFGYGSLIWKPDFTVQETVPAVLRGYHRSLCLQSRVNRGTPDCPGLVFGLDRGGSCRGVALRLAAADIEQVFPQLWAREMGTGAYTPRWMPCSTPHGTVHALAFVMRRSHPAYVPDMPMDEVVATILRASGHCGPCVDYVVQTDLALKQAGIVDSRLKTIIHALSLAA